jgi:hypothetical protein
MFRSFLFSTLGATCALAATISTQVNCNGEAATGTLAASCSNAVSGASATIRENSLYQDSVEFSVEMIGATSAFPEAFATFSASATFQDDYLLRVTGGSGAGFIMPCISTSEDDFRGSGSASITFGNTGLGTTGSPRYGPQASCERAPTIPLVPFTFGVPQIIGVSMGGTAQARTTPSLVDDLAFLNVLQFFDSAGNQLTNVHFTLISTSVPEPGTLALLSSGLFFVLSAGRRHRGFRF